MKRFLRIACLSLVMLMLITVSPHNVRAADASLSSLQNACSALEMYLYPAVYQNSSGYAEYLQTLNRAKEIAGSQNASEKQISDAYNNLRSAFISLMKSTYDYSGIESIVSIEGWLDPALYDEGLVTAFQEKASLCRQEITSPHLYPIENRSNDEYISYMQSKLDEIEADAVSSYNLLVLKPLPDTFTVKSLLSLTEAMKDTILPDSISGAKGREEYEAALNGAKTVLESRSPSESNVSQSAEDLIRSYNDFLRQNFDFSKVDNILLAARSIKKDEYWEKSYVAFSEAENAFATVISQPIFYHSSIDQREASYLSQLQEHISSLADDLAYAEDSLVTLSQIEELNTLCERYENATSDPSLSAYLSALQMAVQNGKDLLSEESFTSAEIDQAIKLIKDTAENLQTASEQYESLQSGEAKSKDSRVKLIISFSIVTLALAVGLAVFLSMREYGSVDFTK